jgi:hypothetical protein
VVVDVGRAGVVLALVIDAPVLVGMDEQGVIVVVLVIVGAVLELAEWPACVVMRDVIVVVRVDDRGVGVLVLEIARDALHRLLSHGRSSGGGVSPRLARRV